MPRFPRLSPHAQAIRASTFEALAEKLKVRARDPEFVPLHLGDTCTPPPQASRRVDLEEAACHRYGPVTGDPRLREAGARDLERLGFPVAPEDVFVTPGATGGLDVAVDAVLTAGDEVIVLTPTWPLVLGLLQGRGCQVVEVDVDEGGWVPPDAATLRDRVERAITPRTAAISLCNPNNPCGFIYSPAQLAALHELARANDLWIFYDGVYADLTFEHEPILDFVAGPARERTFAVTSYSKSFGLAGQRVGLLVPPPAARHLIPRLQTHSTYHTGNLAQRMVLAALSEGDPIAERAERLDVARRGAALVSERLSDVVPFRRPQAGAFAFLDLRDRVSNGEETLALLDRCLEAGVSLAPGGAFGERFQRFARLCFTAVPEDRLVVGLERLRAVLAG